MKPRGIRNNNPLNIRRSTDRWVGVREEQTDKSFVQFKSMAYGYRAAWKTLQSYYNRFCQQSKAIFKGYRLAFPENVKALDEWLEAEDEYSNW